MDEEEFLLLYNINNPSNNNLVIPFWNHERFDLERITDDECKLEFLFLKNDIYALYGALDIPDEIVCCNGFKVSGICGLCVLLKRFAYPCRYTDMIPRFALSVPQLCMVSNTMLSYVFDNWCHLLRTFDQNWLSRENLQRFANIIHEKDAPLDNCWGFVDGTVRRVCRPGRNQIVLYDRHKKVHGIKFQSVVAPNGMVANLYGHVEGRKHDTTMLVRSNLLANLQEH